MNVADLVVRSSPPEGLDPELAAAWRELAPSVRVRIERHSPAEQAVLRDPERFERVLLAGFTRVVEVLVLTRRATEAGLPPPALHRRDEDLLTLFGLHPRWRN